jgi:hypothetical protein
MNYSDGIKIYGPTKDLVIKTEIRNLKIQIAYRTIRQTIKIAIFTPHTGICTIRLRTPDRNEQAPIFITSTEETKDFVRFLLVPPIPGITANNQVQFLIYDFFDTLLPIEAIQPEPIWSTNNGTIVDI